jgi:hypothetical protein
MAGYLLDSNAIIYFFNGEKKIADLIEKTKDDLFVSFITKIEILAFEGADRAIQQKIEEFFDEIKIVLIDDGIIEKTIQYRKNTRLKIPDAIICATAKALGLTLVTADKSLSKKIKGIHIISPL